jgi:hypothetical protein
MTLIIGLFSFPAGAWQPTGHLEELFDDTLLPRLRPGVVAASFSSYDRTGGNDDGFSGTYSKLRVEDGNSVIAEMEGPGCICRMWFTHSDWKEPGLLDRKGEHIRMYLDGGDEPALDVPIEDLFNGSLKRFPDPIAGQGIGGFYSYVPIPYRESCKVVVEGQAVRFYQLNYVTFPSDEGVQTFTMKMSGDQKRALKKAVDRWGDPLGQLTEVKCQQVSLPFVHEPGGKIAKPFFHTLEADNGLMMVHGMTLEGVSQKDLQRCEIEIACDEPDVEPVRLPMALFFGQGFSAEPFTSLMFGREGDVVYNRVPVVYAGTCTIRFHSILHLEGTLTVYQSVLDAPAPDVGRLAVQVNEGLPTVPGILHPLLQTTGRGHVVGTYLVTEGPKGPKGLPYWLEGDDRWVLDGELCIHGTGSEDYFNCGWYALPGRLNGPEALPSHGFPVYGTTEDTMRAAAFRWHFSDPVPFDKTIDFTIEHGEANKHIANYRSVTYYYRAR